MMLILKQKLHLKITLLTLSALFFLGIVHVSAQSVNSGSKMITGIVVDEKGEPVIGASILVKSTKNGTITNLDGKFSLSVQAGATFVVSYIGYDSQDIKVGTNNFYKVSLSQNSKNLDEVVVVGYGTISKRSFSGSSASVKSEDLTALKTMGPTQALQGRAAGVNVTTSSGMPGAKTTIRIRGTNSISSGNDPLWIIDGVPMYSGGGLEASSNAVSQDPMSMINPNDIESMEVLKDAAATAIYGSRGSNGVIMITTKSGKKMGSKGSVSVDYTMGYSDLSRKPQDIGFANSQQWIAVADKAIQNSTGDITAVFNPAQVLSVSSYFEPLTRDQALQTNSNWFNEVLRTGEYKDVNLNFTRGFEGGSVYSSFNYRNDVGILKNNDIDRLTGRVNTEFTVIKNLTVGTNMSFSYSKNNRVKIGAAGNIGGGAGSAGGFESANRNALPWMPIYSTVDKTGYWSSQAGNLTANNDRRFIQDYVDQYRVVGNAFAEFKVEAVKGLSLRTEMGMDYINNSSVDWRYFPIMTNGKTYVLDQNVNRRVVNSNAFLKYNNTIGIHSFNSVLGMESTSVNGWTRLMEGNGVTGDFPELGSNASEKLQMSSRFSTEDYLRSYFFRTDYRLMDKYVLAVSYRRDGSSKFSPEYRWGNFTAISGAWLVSEEKFFASFRNTMNQLKLKLSYGQTGNNSVPEGIFTTTWSNAPGNRYGLDTDIAGGTFVSGIGNSSITWETTDNIDYGIDFGFLNNRISGSIEGYYKKVSRMLLKADLPPSTGVGGNSIWANIGDMDNYGVDFNINSKNIDTKDFSWSTDFNISFNQNKILSLTPALNVGGKGISYRSSTQNVTGNRLGTFLMADYAGIDPDKGVEMIWEIDQTEYNKTGNTIKTGRKIPATAANVGLNRYLFQDKTIIPTFFGGFNNTFKSHGFDLNVFLTFSGGNYIYDYNIKRASYIHDGSTVLLANVNENTIWTPGKTDAQYPIQIWQSNNPNAAWLTTADDPNFEVGNKKGWWAPVGTGDPLYSPVSSDHSKFLYKGDYIRLKNVALGYSLPKSVTTKLAIQQLRFFIQCSNLLTFTAYPGYDPEGASYVNAQSIPNTRTLSFGVSAKL